MRFDEIQPKPHHNSLNIINMNKTMRWKALIGTSSGDIYETTLIK